MQLTAFCVKRNLCCVTRGRLRDTCHCFRGFVLRNSNRSDNSVDDSDGSATDDITSQYKTNDEAELRRLLQSVEGLEPNDIPPEVRQRIEDVVRANSPDDLTVRMQMLGFTPFTLAGFALAGVILLLNNVLGYGWASELLGFSESHFQPDSSSVVTSRVSDGDGVVDEATIKELQSKMAAYNLRKFGTAKPSNAEIENSRIDPR